MKHQALCVSGLLVFVTVFGTHWVAEIVGMELRHHVHWRCWHALGNPFQMHFCTLWNNPLREVLLLQKCWCGWLRFPAVHANVQGGIEYLEARLSPRMPGFFYLVLCGLIPQGHSSPRFQAIRWPMPTIYISDSGDDKNDGLSLQTPIYSFKRAKELHGGRNDCSWHFGPRAWKRIQKELSEKDKRPM